MSGPHVGRYSDAFLAELKDRVNLGELVARYVVGLKGRGRERLGLCPFHTERTPSFTVREDKGLYKCFGCGASGDAISFLRDLHGLEFDAAVAQLAGEVGMGPRQDGSRATLAPKVKRVTADQEQARREWSERHAAELWAEGLPTPGTPAELYFRRRGITIPLPLTLRYHPELPWWEEVASGPRGGKKRVARTMPGMLGAVWSVDRKLITLHRWYLTADGQKADVAEKKKALGSFSGGAIRLSKPARILAIAEGVENAMAVAQSLWDERVAGPLLRDEPLALWSAVSLGNLAGGGLGPSVEHPEDGKKRLPSPVPDIDRPGVVLPDWCEEVVLIGDGDSDPHITRALLRRAAVRFQHWGKKVRVAMASRGLDMNDMLLAAADPACRPPPLAPGELLERVMAITLATSSA